MLMVEFIAKQRGIKNTEIANLVGVSPQTVYKWFKELKPIPKEHLEKISKQWGVDMDLLKEKANSEVIGDVERNQTVTLVENLAKQTTDFKKSVKVILQPASKDAEINYQNTIENTVAYELLERYLDEATLQEIREIYDGEEPQVWATKDASDEGNRKQFEKIAIGDIALFYGNWSYYSQMEITYLLRHETLGDGLWQDAEYKNIYFVTNVKSINLPVEYVNQAIDPGKYSDLDSYKSALFRFRVQDEESSERVLNLLDIDFTSNLVDYTDEEFKEAVKFETEGNIDASVKRVTRVEQGFLRRKLFGKKVYSHCACCREKLPTSMLWAAHIKKRSLCTFDEKINSRIVMPMCKLGCDALYEDGYISVGNDGKFVSLSVPTNKITSRIQHHIDEVVGNECGYWDTKTKEFFEWHYKFHSTK